MKMLLCPECGDVRKLGSSETRCECGKSWGKYLEDGLRAVYGGESIIIGLDNNDVRELVRRDRLAKTNIDFEILLEKFRADWFIIPEGHNIQRMT
jgi:hypothetical protein